MAHGAVVVLLAILSLSCTRPDDGRVHLKFWGMGREGEVVRDLIPDFERQNPGIRVTVQQMPWSAAHEKLLTAFVGDSTPDLVQLGNTWIPEFAAIDAIAPLDARLAATPDLSARDFFPGIWDSNVVDGKVYGIPWYVDTRLLFYRTDLVKKAGFPSMPRTTAGFATLLERLARLQGAGRVVILLPLNEYNVPVIFAMQEGAPMLREGGRFGNFREPRFQKAFTTYVDLFRRGFAPRVITSQVANVFHQFAAGDFPLYPTGPWNVGEFKTRLPPAAQGNWTTSAWPSHDGKAPGLSIAGGSSLALFRATRHPEEAWKLVRFLAEPAQQLRFHALTGNLPAHVAAWQDPALRQDRYATAFYEQLQAVQAVPKIPEWERIATKITEASQAVVNGRSTVDEALARLDREVDQVLEKRRFLLDRKKETEAAR